MSKLQHLVSFLKNNLLVISALGLTIITSSAAGIKIAQVVSEEIANQEQNEVQEILEEDDEPTVTPTFSDPLLLGDIVDPQTNNTCIVTLFGQRYNVSPLLTSHSGGNVFLCGSDMTNVYTSQHGMDKTRMARYLILENGAVAPSISPVVVPGNVFDQAMLALHNKDGDCYLAHRGIVYDVSMHPSWAGCLHHGRMGGVDITAIFPHPLTYLTSLSVVGVYSGPQISGTPGEDEYEDEEDDEEDEKDDDRYQDDYEDREVEEYDD